MCADAELKQYQALEKERSKWEDKENQLWEQLRKVRGGVPEEPRAEHAASRSVGSLEAPLAERTRRETPLDVEGSSQTVSALATTLMSQQLPPLSKFSGDNAAEDGETFEEWVEQFEMVALACMQLGRQGQAGESHYKAAGPGICFLSLVHGGGKEQL